MTSPVVSLKGRALRWLSQREYTSAELAKRLAPHAADALEVDALLRELRDKGYLSDARATEAMVRRRQERVGTARLQQELRQRGVPAPELAQAVQALRATEAERAAAVWERKYGQAPSNPAEAARQMRFLAARGFDPGVIRRVVPRAESVPMSGENSNENSDEN